MAGAIIDMYAVVDRCCVIWPGVVVNHHSRISQNSFLCPNSTVCGFVSIGNSCFIGAGAVIADHRNVPDETIIKAGSLYK